MKYQQNQGSYIGPQSDGTSQPQKSNNENQQKQYNGNEQRKKNQGQNWGYKKNNDPSTKRQDNMPGNKPAATGPKRCFVFDSLDHLANAFPKRHMTNSFWLTVDCENVV